MRKLSDIIKENDETKKYSYKLNVVVGGTISATSEANAGETVDQIVDTIVVQDGQVETYTMLSLDPITQERYINPDLAFVKEDSTAQAQPTKKMFLDDDNYLTIPEMEHIITPEESEKLNNKFKEEDSEDFVHFDYAGKTIKDAIKGSAPDEDFEFEHALHILETIFPGKFTSPYNGDYPDDEFEKFVMEGWDNDGNKLQKYFLLNTNSQVSTKDPLTNWLIETHSKEGRSCTYMLVECGPSGPYKRPFIISGSGTPDSYKNPIGSKLEMVDDINATTRFPRAYVRSRRPGERARENHGAIGTVLAIATNAEELKTFPAGKYQLFVMK